MKTEQEILDLADRLQGLVKDTPIDIGAGKQITVTTTVGIVKYPFFKDERKTVPWQQLISFADMGLYLGKQKRDCWVLVKPKSLSEPEELTKALQKNGEELIEKGFIEVRQSHY